MDTHTRTLHFNVTSFIFPGKNLLSWILGYSISPSSGRKSTVHQFMSDPDGCHLSQYRLYYQSHEKSRQCKLTKHQIWLLMLQAVPFGIKNWAIEVT